jgi:hypothetical protein
MLGKMMLLFWAFALWAYRRISEFEREHIFSIFRAEVGLSNQNQPKS